MTEGIEVEDDTDAVFAELEDEGETFAELLARLVHERRRTVREGAGLWSRTDAAEKARHARLK